MSDPQIKQFGLLKSTGSVHKLMVSRLLAILSVKKEGREKSQFPFSRVLIFEETMRRKKERKGKKKRERKRKMKEKRNRRKRKREKKEKPEKEKRKNQEKRKNSLYFVNYVVLLPLKK